MTRALRSRLGRSSRWRRRRGRRFHFTFSITRVAVESPGRREFAEFVTHHVFRAVDRNELMTVMNRERHPDHLRQYHRAPRPGPNDPFVTGGSRCFDLLLEMVVDEWTFFE